SDLYCSDLFCLFQARDGIRDRTVTGIQTCALPISLDIGTRSVTGIILKKADNAYSLVDYYVEEHRARSMHDGQIHHVLEVANVINNVKKALELDRKSTRLNSSHVSI